MDERLTVKLGREPRYLLADAAVLADVPAQTLRTWACGWKGSGSRNPQPALIKLDGVPRDPISISFFNLIEVGFLSAYRRLGVPMQRVRSAIEYAQSEMEMDRPLLGENFRVNGKDLFVDFQEREAGRRLVNVSRSGQRAWPEVVEDHFKAIEYDQYGPILRWLRERPIVGINPTIQFGLPCIVRRGIATHVIAGRFRADESLEEIAEDLSVELEEVEEALRWETEALSRAA